MDCVKGALVRNRLRNTELQYAIVATVSCYNIVQCVLLHHESLLLLMTMHLKGLVPDLGRGFARHSGGERGRSGTVLGGPPGASFWVLPKRSIPKPDQCRKDVIQQRAVRH